MRNFNRLLQKGNLTPKERHFLKVANMVSKEKEGKAILSEADEYALIEGWQPQTNEEVKEYNRYNQAWRVAMFTEADAQTVYLNAKIKYQTLTVFLQNFEQYPIYNRLQKAIHTIAERVKKVNAKEAIDIINRQREEKLKGGQTIDGTIYQLAFELIDEETKKKLLALFEDAETEQDYLDEELELAELYKKKDFKAIAERVSKKCYNSFAKEYQLFHYYACIPLKAIAERYAKENSLPYEDIILADEDKELSKETGEPIPESYKTKGELEAVEELAETLEKHAKEKSTTVEAIIKETCLKWINEGLLENDYTPLVISEPELLNKWTDTKEKARKTLQDLIKKGELKQGKAERDGADIIKGESLYNSKLDYTFVKDFKTYIDEYSPQMGLVKNEKGEVIDDELLLTDSKGFSPHDFFVKQAQGLLGVLSILQEKKDNGQIIIDIENKEIKGFFLRLRDDFIKEYENLLAFKEFFDRFSKVYDMDLSYRLRAWTNDCKDMAEKFNEILTRVLKPFMGIDKEKTYKDKEFFINIKKITPNKERAKLAFDEVSKLLGDTF